ncbi:MAG TPA: hypothetical protein PK175_05250 [Syntrophales bacterium]|nr:hypothetical protein [Syntrophales bacterium]HOU76915.1 hypothetical protein [Syntrophales bacterium]HPC31684.1 hypothetical protein [Syntrophales bacterium]HQG34261.1 hypothetical protein [Syntrophales bacterium]HQI35462.1 hypothetical protein [Syntrophales bacterium]
MGGHELTGCRLRFCLRLGLPVMVVIFLLAACAAPGPPPPPGSLAARFQSDTALFREGYERLRGVEKPRDYEVARQTFLLILEKYPKSKWRDYAAVYLRLLNEQQALRKEAEDLRNQGQADRRAAVSRQAELEKELREQGLLMEKGRSETVRLLQENQALRLENERLTNKLDSLKRLEIELERRDKLYR